MSMADFGCRFSLYPMCDDFISIILGALEKTDTSAVYSFTDRVSTVYQGGTDSVVDAVKGLFVNAFTDGVHMCLEGVFSNREKAEKVPLPTGHCPNLMKVKDVHFPAKGKVSLYCPGGEKILSDVCAACKDVSFAAGPYAVRMDGDIQRIFSFMEGVISAAEKEKFSLHFTLSVNSPTAE